MGQIENTNSERPLSTSCSDLTNITISSPNIPSGPYTTDCKIVQVMGNATPSFKAIKEVKSSSKNKLKKIISEIRFDQEFANLSSMTLKETEPLSRFPYGLLVKGSLLAGRDLIFVVIQDKTKYGSLYDALRLLSFNNITKLSLNMSTNSPIQDGRFFIVRKETETLGKLSKVSIATLCTLDQFNDMKKTPFFSHLLSLTNPDLMGRDKEYSEFLLALDYAQNGEEVRVDLKARQLLKKSPGENNEPEVSGIAYAINYVRQKAAEENPYCQYLLSIFLREGICLSKNDSSHDTSDFWLEQAKNNLGEVEFARFVQQSLIEEIPSVYHFPFKLTP